MLKGYDIDGVITAGVIPDPRGVIITGRSFEEAAETIQMLRSKGIFNAVYFNPVPFGGKSLENSGKWKAKMIRKLNVSEFYEDEEIQRNIIEHNTDARVIHVTKKWLERNIG